MTVERQRFCPVCDRLFNDGEAVLRCDGCGIRHHPGCWVRNDGCVTESPHDSQPVPEAYLANTATREVPAQAMTGTGGYVRSAPPPVGYVSGPPSAHQPAPRRREHAPDDLVIGRPRPNARPPVIGEEQPPVAPVNRPKAKGGRYPDLSGGSSRPMPSIYAGNRYLRFWYVPVAVLLAVAVALGVIWGVDRLTGGDDASVSPAEGAEGAAAAETATPTPGIPVRTPVGGGGVSTPTAGAGETPVADPNAPFAPGDAAVVVDTGDCLNVRAAAGLGNDAIACIPDGTGVTVLAGPIETDGFSWWQLDTPQGQGWAAADYLDRP